tara:strand:+ start:1227 stop:1889 length:663 start_codon:yes stop_codon:yes gene_type:complete
MPDDEKVIINKGNNPVAALIMLHGLGADSSDLEPIAEMMSFETEIQFVFPNAPKRPISLNDEAEMRAWYNVSNLNSKAAKRDISESVQTACRLIEEQINQGIKSENIFIGGFSQGGVIAIETGLQFPKRLAGVIGLSTYIDDHEHLAERIQLANLSTPVLLAHGIYDPIVHISKAITARETLRNHGYQVSWHEYPVGHQLSKDGIETLNSWINQHLGTKN